MTDMQIMKAVSKIMEIAGSNEEYLKKIEAIFKVIKDLLDNN